MNQLKYLLECEDVLSIVNDYLMPSKNEIKKRFCKVLKEFDININLLICKDRWEGEGNSCINPNYFSKFYKVNFLNEISIKKNHKYFSRYNLLKQIKEFDISRLKDMDYYDEYSYESD